jgi:hypothetical protein
MSPRDLCNLLAGLAVCSWLCVALETLLASLAVCNQLGIALGTKQVWITILKTTAESVLVSRMCFMSY